MKEKGVVIGPGAPQQALEYSHSHPLSKCVACTQNYAVSWGEHEE